MKEFFLEYLRVIINTILGLIFAFAAFYLIMNYYHYTEIRRTFYKGSDDVSYNGMTTKIEEIKRIAEAYKYEDYKGTYEKEIIDTLNTNVKKCLTIMESSSLYKLTGGRYINVKDTYQLASDFENKVINKCLVLEFNWIIDENNKDLEAGYLKDIRPYVKSLINSISRNITTIKNQVLNNSSYYFNTNTASSTVWDVNRNSYQMLVDSNMDVLDFTLMLANYTKGGEINE